MIKLFAYYSIIWWRHCNKDGLYYGLAGLILAISVLTILVGMLSSGAVYQRDLEMRLEQYPGYHANDLHPD